jgi:PAS domain S-box-containing protein
VRLSLFISQNKEPILEAWERFARTIEPPALTMDDTALRDHASLMLDTIIADIETPQSSSEQSEKSLGQGPRENGETYAEAHATQRLEAGYTIDQLVSEYRALRTSVLQLWAHSPKAVLLTDPDDVTRFNEGIDQALAESVACFSQKTAALAQTERNRLTAVLEAAPVGIGMVDKNGKMVLVNFENRRIWGKHPVAESLAELSDWKGWWADGSEKHGQPLSVHEWALMRALHGGESARDVIEIEPFDAPGERRTVLLHAEPIRDAIKNVVGSVMAQMDITAQVKMEAALRESEAKFRTIANAMPQMIWSTLPNGLHDYYNQRWYDFTGVAEGSTDGEDWNGMFHPDDRSNAWALWRQSLATGEVYEVQYRLRHYSGEYRWTLGRALPILDESGEIIRWMGTCTDIHDQKVAEELLREESQRKDEFLAMLAHELRNPLAPISTAAQMLKMVGVDEKRIRHASDVIARQVKHMTNLVDDLLDVSRITRGLVELESENLDLKLVLSGAVEQARPLIEARHHELHIHLCSNPVLVRGDKTRLVQVLANLLNNAAKYTSQSGQIELRLEADGGWANVQVIDNGSGIAPTLLPHIFDLFTQAERTPDRAQGGLGLGLSLVKNITALHGGHVAARSEGLGKGSAFTVRFPLVTNKEEQQAAVPLAESAGTFAHSLSLMIVDDNLDAGQSLGALLEAFGHDVMVMEDAGSALMAAKNTSVAVFILDIGLPGMDGYELVRRLRAETATADAVMIALTGYGQAHDRVLTKAAGFDHHFVKPIDTGQLTQVLEQVSRRKGVKRIAQPGRA